MFNDLLNKPESYRHKVALGSSATITLVIASIWAFSNGFFNFSATPVVTRSNNEEPQQLIAAVVASNSSINSQNLVNSKTTKSGAVSKENSPFSNTKNAFNAAFSEFNKQFSTIKESVSSVIVPFITGIDVYHKTEIK